ncbi:retrotransposon ORF1 [Tanacetum coccineum]
MVQSTPSQSIPKQQSNSYNDIIEESDEEEKENLENIHVNPSIPPDLSISFITKNFLKFTSFFESLGENSNRGVSNFIGRIKGVPIFIGNFTYVIDFMIVEDISSIIDPRMSHVVLGRPFVKISNMTHDPREGVVRFTNGTEEVAYKKPHKIDQYNSLSNLEKEHTKSVYLKNEEDKRIGVEYMMSKILGFYKKCFELGPEYAIVMDYEGEVM